MTAQVPEELIRDGQSITMECWPELPRGDVRLEKLGLNTGNTDEPDLIFHSTGCWRGYIGTWEIRDGQFYLVRLRGQYRIKEDKPIFADWYSGILRIPQSEEETLIRIERGRVVRSILMRPHECPQCRSSLADCNPREVAPIRHALAVAAIALLPIGVLLLGWVTDLFRAFAQVHLAVAALGTCFGVGLALFASIPLYLVVLTVLKVPLNPVRCSGCGLVRARYAYLKDV